MHFKTGNGKPCFIQVQDADFPLLFLAMKLVALATLVAAACSAAGGDRPPDPRDVLVLSPGSSPREVLHYALAKGSKSTVELAIDTELTAGDMGGAMPTVVVTLEVAVDDVLPDGRMKLHTTIADATARDREGERANAIAAATVLAELKGLAIAATLSPDGKLADTHVDTADKKLPADATAQLAPLTRSFEHLAMPLPEVAVGPGAVWTSWRPLDLEGMSVTSLTVVELVSITGSQLGFSGKTIMSGPDQQTTRQGLAIDVTNLRGVGSSQGTIDLAKMTTAGTVAQQFHADMTAAGEKTAVDMKMKLELTPR